MSSTIVGASVMEQELYDYLLSHADSERSIIDEYRRWADCKPSGAFAFVARLILADEERHHRMFEELAESIKKAAELAGDIGPVPPLSMSGEEDALQITERFLMIEKHDLKELRALSRRLKDMHDTTLWSVLVESMQYDTKKHIHLLEFMRDRLRHPAW